jgi:hypothetical protein
MQGRWLSLEDCCKQTCGPANCRGMYLVPKSISLPYICFSYLNVTFFQISLIPHEHECMSIGNLVNKMASAHWVSERVVHG